MEKLPWKFLLLKQDLAVVLSDYGRDTFSQNYACNFNLLIETLSSMQYNDVDNSAEIFIWSGEKQADHKLVTKKTPNIEKYPAVLRFSSEKSG